MVSQRYAKSLLLAAKEERLTDKILEDIKKIEELMKDKNVRQYIISPSVSRDSKFEFIDSVSEKLGLLDLTKNFLKLLVRKKRINLIDEIITYFYLYYEKETGVERVTVFTSDRMGDEELKLLKEKLEKVFGKKFEIEVKENPDILLGLEIVGRDWRISYSARQMLRNILDAAKSPVRSV